MLARRPESLLAELNRLESLRDPGRGGQNRRFGRFVIRGDAELHPMSRSRLNREPVEVKLRDIGRGGIGFISTEPLPAESTWRLCILQHGYVVGMQAVMVRHCRPVDHGLYLIGAQVVVDTGLMTLLGVDPGTIQDGDSLEHGESDDIGFLPPGEVA